MISLALADRTITTPLPALIMGIVNCTPDSFYAQSRGGVDEALRLIAEGADIIDVGGESTRPGASYISAPEEIERVVPVIQEIRKHSSVPISVDTRKLAVMEAAYESGADIVNDVSALEDEPQLASFAALHKLPVILMHKRGIPVIMQKDTAYQNVFAQVDDYLARRAAFAEESGIDSQRIIVDPGIGFGKDLVGNEELILRCGELCGGAYKVLMALSRKSCIGELTGRKVGDRLPGTLAANLIAVQQGASLVRVHDVGPCRDMLAVLAGLSQKGAALRGVNG